VPPGLHLDDRRVLSAGKSRRIVAQSDRDANFFFFWGGGGFLIFFFFHRHEAAYSRLWGDEFYGGWSLALRRTAALAIRRWFPPGMWRMNRGRDKQ